MKIAVTRADQDVARLDVALAERLGERVDPAIKMIADMDRSTLDVGQRRVPSASAPTRTVGRARLAKHVTVERTADTATDTASAGGFIELHNSEVVTLDGWRLGGVGQVYLDDHTGEPSWISVKTGWFGADETLLPLEGARWTDDGKLRVPLTSEAIKGAPRVDADDHLSSEDQDELLRYYGTGEVVDLLAALQRSVDRAERGRGSPSAAVQDEDDRQRGVRGS